MLGELLDMKNTNALYTVSMLAALVEDGKGDYFSLLTPFVLRCLPDKTGEMIDIKSVTEQMQNEYGFGSFIQKLTENLLDKLCSFPINGISCIEGKNFRGKRCYFVKQKTNDDEFQAKHFAMRQNIDSVVEALQRYLEKNFICSKVDLETLKVKLIDFFEEVGFSISTKDVEEIQEITAKNGRYNFAIARFVIQEYNNKSFVFEKLVEIAKGFLSYKAIYFFFKNKRETGANRLLSPKLKDVWFYLDSSLVIDALKYDSDYEYEAIDELIKLIRESGGMVSVFPHTIEEVQNTIEAYSTQMNHANSFRLDNLASMHLTPALVSSYAKSVDKTLYDNVKVKANENLPSITDPGNYRFSIGETEIVDFLEKRRKGKYGNNIKRHRYDASSLQTISVIRGKSRPSTIERGKAILLTQDPMLNTCMYSLFGKEMKHEIPYAIIDTDLAALLWIRNHADSTIPNDLLISYAHAACQVSQETIERAYQLAQEMEKKGLIPEKSSLVISTCTEFKPYLAETLCGNQEGISEENVATALGKYNSSITEGVRKEEQEKYQASIAEKEQESKKETEIRDQRIEELEKELAIRNAQIQKTNEQRDAERDEWRKKDINRAEQKAQKFSAIAKNLCYTILLFSVLLIAYVYLVPVKDALLNGNDSSWKGFYYAGAVLGFIGTVSLIVPQKSLVRRLINFIAGKVYSHVYSKELRGLQSN